MKNLTSQWMKRSASACALALTMSVVVLGGASSVSADPAGAQPGAVRGAAASLSAGGNTTCVLVGAGEIKCWGSDSVGQVGDGDPDGAGPIAPFGGFLTSPSPAINLPGGKTATAIGVDGENACVLLNDRSLTCWGSDESGQNGDGMIAANLFEPTNVVATTGTIAGVAVGDLFICGLLDTGQVGCWGDDDLGQLGNGGAPVAAGGGDIDTALNAQLVDFPGNRTATAISAGGRTGGSLGAQSAVKGHVCAVLDNGGVSCWGLNDSGQIGNGSTIGPAAQVTGPSAPLTLPAAAAGVSVGTSHSCALLVTGAVSCWGSDASGQLGNGATAGNQGTPTSVTLPANRTAKAVAAGGDHTCALLDDNSVACWGENGNGQIGNGGGADVVTPTLITLPGGTTAKSVSTGDEHTCALLANGGVTCWGSDALGQLGNGLAGPQNTPPVAIAGITVIENAAPPSAPVNLTAVGGKGTAALTWTAPVDNGGSAIVGYRVEASIDDGASWTTVITNTGSTATSANPTGLTGGVTRFRVAGINGVGLGTYSTPSATVTVEGGEIITLNPVRLLDTRPTGETIDDVSEKGGLNVGGQFVTVKIAGRGGVPTDAAAAVLNVTIVGPQGNGFATVFPCSATPPNVSTVNFLQGENTPNAAVAKLSAAGEVCVFTSVTGHIIVDATGFIPAGAAVQTIDPQRFLDTRSNGMTIDGVGQGTGRVAVNGTAQIKVAGRGNVPATAAGAILNVTAVRPGGGGFATVYPCTGGGVPNTSNLNYRPNVTVANAVISDLSVNGEVCVFTSAATDVIIDVVGFLPSTSPVNIDVADRMLDTRPGQTTLPDGVGAGGGKNAAGTVTKVQIAGRGAVPADATAVILNVTIVQPEGNGFATVYPCSATPPNASNLNFVFGQNVPNLAITNLSAGGEVCVFTSVTAHILIDARGYNS